LIMLFWIGKGLRVKTNRALLDCLTKLVCPLIKPSLRKKEKLMEMSCSILQSFATATFIFDLKC